MKNIIATLMLLAALPAAAATAPKPSIASLQQLPVITLQPYNEAANADAQVAAAFARAQKSRKRVFIDLGGNWRVDCLVLANFASLPEMRRFMEPIMSVSVWALQPQPADSARFGHQKLKACLPC
jgi:hypothetical protein